MARGKNRALPGFLLLFLRLLRSRRTPAQRSADRWRCHVGRSSKNLNRTQWKPLITAQPRTRQPDGTSNRNRFRSDPDSTFGKTTRRRNILLHFITKFNTQKKAPLTSLRSRFVCFCFQPCVSGHAKEEGECPTRRLKTLVCL